MGRGGWCDPGAAGVTQPQLVSSWNVHLETELPVYLNWRADSVTCSVSDSNFEARVCIWCDRNSIRFLRTC